MPASIVNGLCEDLIEVGNSWIGDFVVARRLLNKSMQLFAGVLRSAIGGVPTKLRLALHRSYLGIHVSPATPRQEYPRCVSQ